MKNLQIFFVLLSMLLFACKKDNENIEKTITVSMSANSTNDVYYSFANGEVKSVNRTDWDIAFSVDLRTATILINEGAGVQLYCAGDTNAWQSVDTSNLAALEPRFNNKSDWNIGAFNLYTSGATNYGWGTYNMNEHIVYGDSIYIIKLTDGSYKKLFIRSKIGLSFTYVLRWANIGGLEQIDTTFSAIPFYETDHFLYYSLVTKQVFEVEPDKTWDLLFTKYVVKIPAGPGVMINYTVMGVLINPGIQGVKVTGVVPENANYTDTTATFSSQADVIGWDWKINDPVTHLYSIAENTSYFVKLSGGEIYRIYFTEYGGSVAGTITFKTKLVE
jgi:hypothetical protein